MFGFSQQVSGLIKQTRIFQGSGRLRSQRRQEQFVGLGLCLLAPDAQLEGRKVAMYCTGGIRCEKAAPWLLSQGFREVYQLDGGILNYFEQCGAAHFRGECFVFDQRVALDARLRQTGTAPSRYAWHEPG